MNHENDEDETARRLLAPLAGEPAGSSAVDIRRAMSEGRRRVRTRRVAGLGVVAAMTALVAAGVPMVLNRPAPPGDDPLPVVTDALSPPPSPTGPTAPVACELEYLAVPERTHQSLVTGGDPSGRFILGRSYLPAGSRDSNPGPEVQVLVWDDGDPTLVDVPGYDARLAHVNGHGVAVGSSYTSAEDLDSQVAWVYQDGDLTQLAGTSVTASAINEQDVIVGSQGEAHTIPVMWRSPTAPLEELSVPGPTWSIIASDVDADGTVVGNGYDRDETPDAPDHSFVWLPDGTRQELPWPSINGETAIAFSARSIHDGIITGEAKELTENDGWRFHLFQYDLGTGEFTPLADDVEIGVDAWNAYGWVVGNTVDELVLLASSQPVLLPYPELPENPDDRFAYRPVVRLVSDDGRTIAGQVHTETGQAQAVVWRCA